MYDNFKFARTPLTSNTARISSTSFAKFNTLKPKTPWYFVPESQGHNTGPAKNNNELINEIVVFFEFIPCKKGQETFFEHHYEWFLNRETEILEAHLVFS